jgi:hypothetical protein
MPLKGVICMSDQANGQDKSQDKGDTQENAAPDQTATQPGPQGDLTDKPAVSATLRAAPLIEGEAQEIPAPEEAPAESPSEPESSPPAAAESRRASPSWMPLAALAGVAALGVGFYFSWEQYGQERPPAPGMSAPAPKTIAPPKSEPVKSEPVKSEPPKSEPVKAEPAKAEPPKTLVAPTKAPDAVAAPKPPESAAAKPTLTSPAEKADATRPPESASKSGSDAFVGRLAAAEAALAQANERLQALEAKLNGPKAESRAELSPPDANPARTGDAAARLVLARGLLDALRQGDDATASLDALQALGADPARLAQIRASLADTPKKLAADFAALAPKIQAALEPKAEAPGAKSENKPVHFAETVWVYLQSRAKNLVKVRAAHGPADEAAAHLQAIGKALERDDLAAAQVEYAALPENARALAADWQKALHARLAAEQAAAAEWADAVKSLAKLKN